MIKPGPGYDGEYPEPASPAVTAAMKGNRRSDTKPEVLIRSELHRAGYRFRKDLRIEIEGEARSPRPDIIFTKKKLAVFIDGCYWHYCPEHGRLPKHNTAYWRAKFRRNRERDQQDKNALADAGWTVLRIWEHEPVPRAVEAIKEVLEA